MNSLHENIEFSLNLIRCFPHLVVFYFHKNKSVIQADLQNALKINNLDYGQITGLIYLFAFKRSFRNVFYYRVRPYDFFLNVFCPRVPTIVFDTDHIEPGFVIVHGFASTIGAKSIGKNCTVFQKVTIGAAAQVGYPVILDNVTIYSGAIIMGNVTIGNNVTIGANATVFKSVPDDCTVLPPSFRVMQWKKKCSQ
jgi:serine O-acetyltransferase